MGRTRLEAFSDAVIAIILTIMVLELKTPHGTDFAALAGSVHVFFGYVLSFIYIGIYWNNHHHLMHTVDRVNGSILWANMHLLFWLSLVPFTTGWVGETGLVALPVALYGLNLILAALAYTVLTIVIKRVHGHNSKLEKAVGHDAKGWFSLACYAAGIGFAFISPLVSIVLYVTVALIWLVPDRRIERLFGR